MFDVLVDALVDSLKIFIVVLVVNMLIALFESKISNTLERSKKWSPLVGSTLALIPQCGISVVSTDLYNKKHITPGTLIAIYIATSDEAIPILLSNINNNYLSIILLIILKSVIGVTVGYISDLILFKNKHEVEEHVHHHEECHHEEVIHKGCCNHEIEDENLVHRYLVHPLVHSLKILAYCLIINIIFGYLIYFIGENKFEEFIGNSIYLQPIFATLVGLIPNCASSIFLSNLYLVNGLSFAALLGGLIMNAGLGIMVLFKNKNNRKNNLYILLILFITAIISSYLTLFISIIF